MYICGLRSLHLNYLSKLLRNPLSLWTRLASSKASSSTIQTQLDYFNSIADDWWNPNGIAWVAHQLNPLRIEFIRTQLEKLRFPNNADRPLEGLRILDVGCGAGIVSESLARLGAEVTGLDALSSMIEMARKHAQLDPSHLSKLNYINVTVEEHASKLRGHYDVIVILFIMEHINNRQEFLQNCLHLLKPNGSLFIQHANRTWQLYLVYLWAMYVMGCMPKGVLNYDVYKRLISPEEMLNLLSIATKGNYQVVGTSRQVITYNASVRWTKSNNYWRFLHIKPSLS